MMRSCLVLGAVLVLLGGAQAQSPPLGPPAEPDGARYSYHRSEDGFVRLDLRTGQVSQCAKRGAVWSCLAVPDDRAAFEAEIGRLQADNAALKKALLDRGLPLPVGVKPEASAGPPAKSPGEGEVDRVMGFVERIWRRLVEMMTNLQRDLNKS